MKDLSLSLLSRGCGQVVRTRMNNQDGRIEVCFEPEDYFNWKSQQPVLRLSDSGRIGCRVEPAPPKTYSTRRGPLVLYSADLALPCKPDAVNRNRQGSQHSLQEVELQLHKLRDLTGAILAYDKKQPQDDCGVVDTHPFLPHSSCAPLVPSMTHLSRTWHPQATPCDPPPGVLHDHSRDLPVTPRPTPCNLGDEAGVPHPRPYMEPQYPLPPIPERVAKNWGKRDTYFTLEDNQRIPQTRDLEDQNKTKKLWIVVETPRMQMSPIPETERAEWGSNPGTSGDRQEGPVLHPRDRLIGCPGYQDADGKSSVTGAVEVGQGPCPLKKAFVDSSWGCSRLSHVTYYGGHLSGARLGTTCVLDRKGGAARDPPVHLPPVPSGPLLKPRPLVWSDPERGAVKSGISVGLEKQGVPVRLPPLCDSNVSIGAPAHGPPQSAGAHRCPHSPGGPAHRDSQREMHRKMLLPLLGHGQSEKIDMLGTYEDSPFLGVLPPMGGRKGPGKQSSMAFFGQDSFDTHDICDPHNLQTGAVRGSLPVELREWQNGNAVGTLIMGPDGQIIQLSLWGPPVDTEDQQLLDDIPGERGLKASDVMQEQPWTFLLQTDTGSMASDSVGPQAHMSPSPPSKQCGLQHGGEKKLPDGQHGTEESQSSCSVYEEQVREMVPAAATPLHTTGQQGENARIEGTQSLRPGLQKSPKGLLPREEAPSIDTPEPALPTGEGKTTDVLLSGEQYPKTTDRVLSGEPTGENNAIVPDATQPPQQNRTRWRGQSNQEQVQTGVAVNYKEAHRNKAEQQEENDTRNRNKEAEEAQPHEETLTQGTDASTLSKSKAKGWKEKPQNISSLQARKKRKGKHRAGFVFGKVQDTVLERAAEERVDRAAGVTKKLDGVIPDAVVKDKEQGKEHGASSTTLRGSMNDSDLPGTKLYIPSSHSNRGQGSDRPSSSDLLTEAACHDPPYISAASRTKGQSPTSSITKSQSPATSIIKSLSPAASMIMSKSCAASITESQLSFKATTREAPHVHLVNLDISSNTDGNSVDGVAHREQQGAAGLTGRAEQRRMEVERKRAERDEQRKRQQEKEERAERLRLELQEEQQQRAAELRLKRLLEQEEKQQQEEQEKERIRKEEAEREKERRREVEKRRQLERFLKMRQEEEDRKAEELERLRVEEEERREEERKRLQDMEENEKQSYLLRCHKEEEQRRSEAEERKRREEEAELTRHEAMLQLARQRVALEQKLQFRCGLEEEAESLGLTQSISRPWVYSYFSLLKLLGLQGPPHSPGGPDQ
ncbi:hypothetical protein AAFF_G00318240 [Aldrovandia affinis]|uniref:Uncharacterized protein n=1 Tax=Aldrovandia affinis TaxID=143900 RepID=A0AAD7SPG4_9TELE|nr:hypothetical protein AAFF_G00318240 [Aldrovandia affinis]